MARTLETGTVGVGSRRKNLKLWGPASDPAYHNRRLAYLRNKAIEMCGGSCACCGENRWQFLTIDHVDGDGAEDHRRFGKNYEVLYYSIVNGLHARGQLRVLCANCHIAIDLRGGCPHQQSSDDAMSAWQLQCDVSKGA